MKSRSLPLLLLFVLVLAAAVWPDSAGLALAAAPAMGDASGDTMPFRRLRKDLKAFENVVPTGYATCEIERRAGTLLAATLYLSGTTFNETHITEIRLKLGSKPIWGGTLTGSQLRSMNAYKGYYNGNRQFINVDFTATKCKQYGGWGVGGIDMTQLPAGLLVLEVKTSGATAPALVAKGHWGPPQDNGIIQRLLQFTYSTSSSGRKVIPITFDGARLRRLFVFYAGTSWEQGTATSAAWTGNTGNGVMGTVTATVGAQVGVHKFECIEPGTNVGTFLHQTPDGVIVSSRMIVASAYAAGGLSFTLADGATDFVSGDGFDITVSEITTGNISRVEVNKDDVPVWDFFCHEARHLQKQNGFVPQSLMYVVDFEVDNWADGALKTADARSLEFAVTFTASDALTMYAEVLNVPPVI